jgi:tetratricopeptide (TPR) repeat protein
LSAEYGDQEPEEKSRTLESAVNFALDDDERHMARLRLAGYLSEQGSRQRALDLIAVVLKEADKPGTIRRATTLRWQVSRSEDDFQSLFDLMKAEEDEDSRLAGASYLFDHGKPEAALDLLKSLLDRNNPVAGLSAAEGDIRHGDCVAAAERLSSIKLDDSSSVDVRLGFAHLQALLVLECDKGDMRQTALEQLMELKQINPSPHIDQLIAAPNDSE